MPDASKKNQQEPVSAQGSRVQQWLEKSARKVSARRAVILIRRGDRFTVAAKYTLQDQTNPNFDTALNAAARRAFDEKQVVVRLKSTGPDVNSPASAFVALTMRLSGRPAAMAFEVLAPPATSNQELLVEIARQTLRRADDTPIARAANAAIPSPVGAPAENLAKAPPPTHAETKKATPPAWEAADAHAELLAQQSAVIGALSMLLDQRDFNQALHGLANAIATQWSSLRVSIALVRSKRLVIEAVSGHVDFDPRSALMVDILEALEETRMVATSLALPMDDPDAAPPQCHAALAAELKDPALFSVPLVDDGRVMGAILVERDHRFSQHEQKQLERMAIVLAPVVALKQVEAMGVRQWFRRLLKQQLQALFGPTKLGWKLSGILASVFVLWCCFYTQIFKVDADAAIEASVQRAVVAGFPSFLEQVDKRAGDVVYKGDVLARLDVEDLQLDRIKWVGERDKLAKEHRANLAQRDRSKIRILDAQLSQAQAQLDLLDAQIARATLRAPIDGVVISGDLSQALRSPVERGQLLFEVASLEDYRLILRIDETDIGWVKVGSSGQLRLRSLPDQSFPFSVTSIAPVSESAEGANQFRVEASLGELPLELRPGMEGVAKIDVEPRAIGWIWTRPFMNWLRLQSWKYGL